MLIERKNIIIVGFFALLLGIGLTIYKDYGIAWDEGAQRRIGKTVMDYVVKGDPFLFTFADIYYGAAVEVPLVAIEKILKLDNFRSIFLMRHLLTFLLFYVAVFFFYLLVKNRFQNWKFGLLGSLFLVLSPRIFADSFYNSKDIPFLSVFIVGIYTLLSFLEKKSYFLALLHGLICAFLVDIRMVGILLPFFTVILLIGDLLITNMARADRKKSIACLLIYCLTLVFFSILFWPVLWKNPIHHFMAAVIKASHGGGDIEILYLGQILKASNLPWHYVPVWIATTTPIIYTLLFCIGTLVSLTPFIKNPLEFYLEKKKDLLFLLWFFLPLFSVIFFKSVLYDGWRHLFFIYPAFLMISLIGLNCFWVFIQTKFRGMNYKVIASVFIFAMAFSLMDTAYFMIRYHPFQNVYFNRLAGRTMEEVKNKFELDYWGLSYRQALEYILKNDKDEIIKVSVANYPGRFNANIFRPDEKKRLKYVDVPEDAKYFISNFRWHKEEYPYKNRYYSIKINGAEIMVVYKMEGRN